MKKSLLVHAVLATIASAAYAGEADPAGQYALQIEGSRTRAEVEAEAIAAVEAGTKATSVPAGSKVQPAVDSPLDAVTVRAQAAEAVRLGQIAYGEQ